MDDIAPLNLPKILGEYGGMLFVLDSPMEGAAVWERIRAEFKLRDLAEQVPFPYGRSCVSAPRFGDPYRIDVLLGRQWQRTVAVIVPISLTDQAHFWIDWHRSIEDFAHKALDGDLHVLAKRHVVQPASAKKALRKDRGELIGQGATIPITMSELGRFTALSAVPQFLLPETPRA